jgi:hypothetical protein
MVEIKLSNKVHQNIKLLCSVSIEWGMSPPIELSDDIFINLNVNLSQT